MVGKKGHFSPLLWYHQWPRIGRLILDQSAAFFVAYRTDCEYLHIGNFVMHSEIKDQICPSGCWNWWGRTMEFGRKKLKWGSDYSIPLLWNMPDSDIVLFGQSWTLLWNQNPDNALSLADKILQRNGREEPSRKWRWQSSS